MILNMKHVYTLATFALASLLFANTASAQSYPGGSYTAVRSGNWNAPAGPGFIWDPNGQPPANCIACHVTLADGVAIIMNSDITFSGNSLLSIGSDATSATTLTIPFSSNIAPPTPFPIPSAYNRISIVDGDLAQIKVSNINSAIKTATAGPYDGVFLAVSTPSALSQYAYIARLGPNALYPNPTADFTGPASLNSIGILPILLSSFDAAMTGNVVALSWATALEVNSDHFVVQRSSGNGWENIGNVSASGFSQLPVNYSFTDEFPLAGVNEYRLQSVDRDNKYAYSSIKVIRIGTIATSLNIFPNPASDYVKITFGGTTSGSLTLQLISQAGQLLVEKKLTNAAGTTYPLPISSYPQGNYLILVTGADGSRQVSKLFISRQ
jgi:hypothetical protein